MSQLPKLVHRITKSFQRNLVSPFLVKIAQSFRERHFREIGGNDYQVNIAILPMRACGPRTGQYYLTDANTWTQFLDVLLNYSLDALFVGNERHLLLSGSVCAYSI